MENNLILNISNLKKMLKSICVMMFFIGMSSLDAKGGKAQVVGRQQTQTRTSTGTTTTTAGTRGTTTGQRQPVQSKQTGPAQTKQPQLSALGLFGLKNNTTAETLQTFLDKNRDDLSKEDKDQKTQNIEVIESHIAELKESEKLSSKDQQIAHLQRELTKMRKALQLNKENLAAAVADAMEKKAASSGGLGSYFSGLSLATMGSAITAGAVALASGYGAAISAGVAAPVALSVFGLNKLATRWKTGYWSESTKVDEVAKWLLETQISDMGRYPTIDCKFAATKEGDLINVTKDIPDGIFAEAVVKLESEIAKQRAAMLKESSKEEIKNAEELNEFIAAIRDDYGRDTKDLEGYLNRLAGAKLATVGINGCRALISEYLRTQTTIVMRGLRKQLEEDRKEEAEKKRQEAEAVQQSGGGSWWPNWRMGG